MVWVDEKQCLHISQADDAKIEIKVTYDDMRTAEEHTLGVNDYFICTARYEADEYAPKLFEIKTTTRMLVLPSDLTSTIPVGKYSLDIVMFTEKSDGSFERTLIYPSMRYSSLPSGKVQNFKNLIVEPRTTY